jgi:hypothetical protein
MFNDTTHIKVEITLPTEERTSKPKHYTVIDFAAVSSVRRQSALRNSVAENIAENTNTTAVHGDLSMRVTSGHGFPTRLEVLEVAAKALTQRFSFRSLVVTFILFAVCRRRRARRIEHRGPLVNQASIVRPTNTADVPDWLGQSIISRIA